ncbi:YlmC/YmxH family sporulation protein [Anaerosalibacter sp. Marseille-P3206]|uniref:YlmC/YmxH family sporulation protein n=1 Tax=Anaerosalibacter sp. Marseille-P3206 TaxID=1871005 RepID=UPI00098680DE|nr:YlmC/YmxH family sporulation protein [Anaerosalibacter sp. Marseille-P3206]
MVKISELKEKEVVNVRDGSIVGIIDDVELDLTAGIVRAIIIPSPGKLFSLFSKNQDFVIEWKDIIKIGTDIILIDLKGDE